MSSPSNLYAEKIFSEHPLALWALDDRADYVSLISNSERNIHSAWTKTGVTTSSGSAITGEPFPDSSTTILTGNVPASSTAEIICISPNLVNFDTLDTDLGSFTVGAYIYSDCNYVESISIGYEYTDTTTSLVVQEFETVTKNNYENWQIISGTFEIPIESTNLRAVIKIITVSGGGSTSDYVFNVNGVTVGQWSQEYISTSLGVTPITVPSSISIVGGDLGIEADAYGVSSDTGYYLVGTKNNLFGRNTSVPLVFGASGITKIVSNAEGTKPSLIVPGKGFLNQTGQYNDYTIEFWTRISSNTSTPKRIFGPIASEDGLYVDGGLLTLVIGDKFSSHFVSEWFRPMLVHIRLIKNSASVVLNGEEIISLNINTSSLDLPSSLDSSNDTQDWLGFYSYVGEESLSLEIDCVAIYSYHVPTIVAKRRFVYGQAVASPEGINSGYGGVSAFIDYPFADYTANYKYPDFAQWQQGAFDNLVTTTTSLTTPEYTLPEIFLDTKSLTDFYDDNQAIQNESDKFISFRPNNTWNSLQTYFHFSKFDLLNQNVQAVYGVFKTTDVVSTNRILFKIYNPSNGNYLVAKLEANLVVYSLYYNGAFDSNFSQQSSAITSGVKFTAGINIQSIINTFGGNVSSFFGNRSALKLQVSGETASTTFDGKLYSFGFCTESNLTEIEDSFYSNGIAKINEHENLLLHTASYTLLPTEAYETFFLDIGVSGKWEDYLPLSYFAQYVENDVGDQFYELDFLQFNIGYPSPSMLKELDGVADSWTYQQLRDDYENPIQRSYDELDNVLLTGWNNYLEMRERSVKYHQYDTKNASIKSYLTFQYIVDGANALPSYFTTLVPAKQGSIIDIDAYPDWETTKFEVVNNTLIYPTKTVDFNELAIVYHVEFNVRGILNKPISLRKLEIASQAFNDNSFNPVGTRFGVNIFPYKRAGLYYDYKSKNPFSIYKGSTPYLYLTRDSGIEVRGSFDPRVDRGLSIPINENKALTYIVSSIQMWMRHEEEIFPGSKTELFEVQHKTDTIKFYFVSDSEKGNRARIFALSKKTGLEFEEIEYYWNGNLTKEPVMTSQEWGVLGILFTDTLIFNSYIGKINLTGPTVFNNVAFYQANNLQQVQRDTIRSWTEVKITHPWSYWKDLGSTEFLPIRDYTWRDVNIISRSQLYAVNPADVYKAYLGTNKIIVDDGEGMTFNDDTIKIYSDTIWSSSVIVPA